MKRNADSWHRESRKSKLLKNQPNELDLISEFSLYFNSVNIIISTGKRLFDPSVILKTLQESDFKYFLKKIHCS